VRVIQRRPGRPHETLPAVPAKILLFPLPMPVPHGASRMAMRTARGLLFLLLLRFSLHVLKCFYSLIQALFRQVFYQSIAIGATALSSSKGFVSLDYYSVNYDKVNEEKKAIQDSVF
jgi:hypothetical protein